MATQAHEHTILLFQYESNSPMTRTYLDFHSPGDAIEGFLQMYEQTREDNGKQYVVNDAFEYCDKLADFSCMVWNDT